jgi:hypothetical protein
MGLGEVGLLFLAMLTFVYRISVMWLISLFLFYLTSLFVGVPAISHYKYKKLTNYVKVNTFVFMISIGILLVDLFVFAQSI